MQQVVQNLASGKTILMEVPAPLSEAGHVLIKTSVSLISAGTERMLVDFSRASLLDKVRQQPERVRMVIDKARTDGVLATIDAVRSKLDQPMALGYCNAGVVMEVGRGVSEFKPGDRVVSNGAHASVVSVPKNLCARIPDNVDDQSAAFTVLAAVGLQGIRLAQPTLGETFAVTGLGLIGLMTVQMLRANGCRVIGIDLDEKRLNLARAMGAYTVNPASGEDPVDVALAWSGGKGVDGVIITASTKSSEPVSQAARMCRTRGRIVLVGVAGLELNRTDFYQKEISFQVSCSYGPGRYDPSYEQAGQDYPFGLVRWTEKRNFEAVLSLMAEAKLDVHPLISHRKDFQQAAEAYEALVSDASALAILLDYHSVQENPAQLTRHIELGAAGSPAAPGEPVLGFIGAGNYGSRVLIPAFKAAGARLDTVVTRSGVSGTHHGGKFGFSTASTDVDAFLSNPAINTAVIVTRHDSHAPLAARALLAGKNVFVEKPLALNLRELEIVEAALRDAGTKTPVPRLMVGFNRRFSPLVGKMKSLLEPVQGPKAFVYTCNAGAIPADHWTQDRSAGGGRIIGEACHFVDLLRFLAGFPIEQAQIVTMGRHPAVATRTDKAMITLRFSDGSIGTIQYLANGGRKFPKERIEVFANDAVLQIDNFLTMRGFGWKGFNKLKFWRQDKGHRACAQAFVNAIRNGTPSPISAEELFEVSRITIQLAEEAES